MNIELPEKFKNINQIYIVKEFKNGASQEIKIGENRYRSYIVDSEKKRRIRGSRDID